MSKMSNTNRLITTLYAILMIASRDMQRFLRDPMRILVSLVLPFFLVIVLGYTLQNNLAQGAGYNLVTFIFIGILAQTLFQSTVTGLTSLVEDRENDFTQELFLAPISRYAIIFGKILGESLVALMQVSVLLATGMIAFGLAISPIRLLLVLGTAVVICLLGGAYGVLVLSLSGNQRSATQIVTLTLFPQFFLAGVLAPIHVLPWYLDLLSRMTPMRYAVDLMHGVYYVGLPEYNKTVLQDPLINFIIVGAMFVAFLAIGTTLFVHSERNR